MVRLLFIPVFLSACLACCIALAKEGTFDSVSAWWKRTTSKPDSIRSDEAFQVDLLDQINYSRIAAKLKPVKLDPDLQNFLRDYSKDKDAFDDLDQLNKEIQDALPRYYEPTAVAATKSSHSELLNSLHEFAQVTKPEASHIGITLKQTGPMSLTCLIAIGERLRDFSPEALSQSGRSTDYFHSVCASCGYQHICRVSALQRSQSLECPSCGRTYAVIAADSRGRFRYVNEFLTGYSPPAKFPRDQSRIQELFTIWKAVHSHCAYTRDPAARKKDTDCWQTAVETQNLQRGDCEDSAIFLSDWLISRGFQARMALGRYGDMGGHAWCVVHLDGNDYLLESTEAEPDPSNPPLADSIGSRYVPEVLFDSQAIYVRANSRQSWNGNYWSAKTWMRLEPRGGGHARTAASAAAALAREPRFPWSGDSAVQPGRMAFTDASSMAVAPFGDLDQVPQGAAAWQVPMQDAFELESARR